MTQPSISTIKALFAVSGNACAFPECDRPIVDENSSVVTAEICHIRARRPGGPRYDPDQPEDERQGVGNLMLMCGAHHKIVDERPGDFSVERLIGMKRSHEMRNQAVGDSLDDTFAQQLINHSIIAGSAIQTVNQSGGQVAHTIVNSAPSIRDPDLFPVVHTTDPNPGQTCAFCVHINNQGTGTADEIRVRMTLNATGLACFSPGFWNMGPSSAPYMFTSTEGMHPRDFKPMVQIGFTTEPAELIFDFRIWARNYPSTSHKVCFSPGETGRKEGQKLD